MTDGESRLMWSEFIGRPISGSKLSVQVKIAGKIHTNQMQKKNLKNLDGLFEVVAPSSTVGKVSPTTSIIKETNRPEIRVRNSGIAIFGTRNEQDTELGQYIERTSKKIHKKTLEQKIVNDRKNLTRKDLGSKKIKRNKRQPDDNSIFSS